MGANGSKQEELEGMPNSALRKTVLEAIELQDEIGDKSNDLKQVKDEIRKMMREEKKRHVVVEDEAGRPRPINLVSTGETVSIGKPPKAAKRAETSDKN